MAMGQPAATFVVLRLISLCEDAVVARAHHAGVGFMVGRNKESDAARIERLTRAARATIEMALMRHYGVGRTAPGGAEEKNATKAAAAANFLSGQAPNPTHAGALPQVRTEAREWIRNNVEMRELVVQTLRVTALAHSVDARNDAISEDSSSILSEFSTELTGSPDPLVYEALVRRAIATLPHSTQVQLMRLTKAED
jgi:hypothetical protein